MARTKLERGQHFVWAAALSLALASPLQAEGNLSQEIAAFHARYVGAFAQRDTTALGALFTEDAIFTDQTGKTAVGRQAIEAMFKQGFGDVSIKLEVDADQTGALGDGAWDVGHGALVAAGASGPQRKPLHYAAVYLRQGDALRLRAVSIGAE
jgi:uncharacterized protein (TIGR02246 family)